MCKLQELLGNGFECFESMDKASFVLGGELWDFSSMLDLIWRTGGCWGRW